MRYSNLLDNLVSLGEKKTGSSSNRSARSFIVNAIRELPAENKKYYTEQFPLKTCSCEGAEICVKDDITIASRLFDYTGDNGTQVNAKLVYCRTGTRLDFLSVDVRNKIVVCKSNLLSHRVVQIQRALARGAVGVVVVSNHPSHFQAGAGAPADQGNIPIPAVSIQGKEWATLKNFLNENALLTYKRKINNVMGENIIVDIKKNAEDAFVVIGAHYDSWYAGAQDNCISVVMLLELLYRFCRSNARCNVRCIFFDAEELGLMGSKWHVQNNDLHGCKYYINLEMVLPCRHTLLRTLFFSRGISLMRLPLLQILKNGFVPLPLNPFYWYGNTSFPADVDSFYKKRIPCMTTYCENRYFHTVEDIRERIRLDLFDDVCKMLMNILLKVG